MVRRGHIYPFVFTTLQLFLVNFTVLLLSVLLTTLLS
jgi:hypothetical protein